MPSARGGDLPAITARQKPNPFIKRFPFLDGKRRKLSALFGAPASTVPVRDFSSMDFSVKSPSLIWSVSYPLGGEGSNQLPSASSICMALANINPAVPKLYGKQCYSVTQMESPKVQQ